MSYYSMNALGKSGNLQKEALMELSRAVARHVGESAYPRALSMMDSLWHDPSICNNRTGFGKSTRVSRTRFAELLGNNRASIDEEFGVGVTALLIQTVKGFKLP